MARAVFLDRDGVINRLIYNPATRQYESPHRPEDFKLIPGALEHLRTLQDAGFLLFLVSNQPSYALGKTTRENLDAIHGLLEEALARAGVAFQEVYYCYHHPEAVVAELAGACECRKPSPRFILLAGERHGLDLAASWFIGDQDTDILCGQAAGVKTILIQEPASAEKRGRSQPDYFVDTLRDAVRIIAPPAGE